mmetsp:Transcript_29071/g.49537  ORF Transcript_29071/g.49537 Transcript_29071/m.49537 type:complete len:248 (+) Transcript_29071:859-1602(+)
MHGKVYGANVRRFLPHHVERRPIRARNFLQRRVQPLLQTRYQNAYGLGGNILEGTLLLAHVDLFLVRLSNFVAYQILQCLDGVGAVFARVDNVADGHLLVGRDAIHGSIVRRRLRRRAHGRGHLRHDARAHHGGRQLPLQDLRVIAQLLLERALQQEECLFPRERRAPRDAVLHVDEEAGGGYEDGSFSPRVDGGIGGCGVELFVHASFLQRHVGGHVIVEGGRGDAGEGRHGAGIVVCSSGVHCCV